jgi:hypothetical protein
LRKNVLLETDIIENCHPERIGSREAGDEESTCPGVPWKDPEDAPVTMLRENSFTMKFGFYRGLRDQTTAYRSCLETNKLVFWFWF